MALRSMPNNWNTGSILELFIRNAAGTILLVDPDALAMGANPAGEGLYGWPSVGRRRIYKVR